MAHATGALVNRRFVATSLDGDRYGVLDTATDFFAPLHRSGDEDFDVRRAEQAARVLNADPLKVQLAWYPADQYAERPHD